MYISHYVKSTTVLGPGNRFALWLHGCKKCCKGCIFPEGQGEITEGRWIPEDELFHVIRETQGVNGITISGGEPFLQIEELIRLCHRIKEETPLDIMIYSGYTVEELAQTYHGAFSELCGYIDILIDGEYVEALNDNQAYRGSSNQTIHFMSDKYRLYQDSMNKLHNRNVEFTMDCDGEVMMVGIPPKEFYKKVINRIAELKKQT